MMGASLLERHGGKKLKNLHHLLDLLNLDEK